MKHIKCLNLTGNPVCSTPDYRTYMVAFLKDLVYLDYVLIEPAEVRGEPRPVLAAHLVTLWWNW